MPQLTCSVPECERPAASRRGMCGMHYQRAWKAEHRCSIDGCTRTYLAKGLCGLHYKRQLSGTPFDAPALGDGKAAGCAVEGCTAPYHANGYCGAHAQRRRRTGDPLGILRPTREQCTVEGCEARHNARGYCVGHYKVTARHGAPIPEIDCRRCGTSFVRSLSRSGSYHYCEDCAGNGPRGWAALRRERLAANNEGMTDECRRLAKEYRALIGFDPCVFCGGPGEAVDHIHPVAQGGSDRWTNLAPICQSCNSTKRDRPLLGVLLARLG